MGNSVSRAPVTSVEKPPIYVKTKTNITEADIDAQFDILYRKSVSMLRHIAPNPCEHLIKHIKDCVDNNVGQMAKCFDQLESYQTCVSRKRAKILREHVEDIPTNLSETCQNPTRNSKSA